MLIRALHPWGSKENLSGRQVLARQKFKTSIPPEGTIARLKASHPTGDYTLPFVCRWSAGRWLNDRTGAPIAVEVVGWRYVSRQLVADASS